MSLEEPTTSWPPWPPEVPPLRPPERPEPTPVLPSWLEPGPIGLDRDVADRLLEQRVIIVGGRLDDSVASRVAAQLLLLDARDTSPIDMHLACADAELEPSLALAGAIDLVESPVHAIARGTLRGPALAVLCAAQHRVAHRHTMFILLSPQFSGNGTAAELATLADQHERQVARMRDLIVDATGRTEQEIGKDLDTGRVLGADEAKDYGLVTELV
jgi:ATP-dependent Clp protease, protease subunit